MLANKVGLDLDALPTAGSLAALAREAGARMARIHVRLAGHPEAGADFTDDVVSGLKALQSAGLRALVAAGPDLTVAPGGLGAFRSPVEGPLAEAWVDEYTDNLARLAEATQGLVWGWELLPTPNAGSPPTIDPRRFAAIVSRAAQAVRLADPSALIVTGGLVCDSTDDGTTYLRAVLEAWSSAGAQSPDAIGLHLELMPEGGKSERSVGDGVSDRVTRVMRLLDDSGRRDVHAVVTSVGWDAGRCGEATQARNLWAAFDALVGNRRVDAIVWRALVDDGSGSYGLVAHPGADRRLSWKAMTDFAVYANQISPAPTVASLLGEPTEQPQPAEQQAESPGTGPSRPTAVEADGSGLPTEQITIRIPSAEELLRAQGLAGDRLAAALASLDATFGSRDKLDAGEYTLVVPRREGEAAAPALSGITNQDVITAFYRAADGSWDMFERSGLSLSDLAARRNEPYVGAAINALPSLTEDETQLVVAELRGLRQGAR